VGTQRKGYPRARQQEKTTKGKEKKAENGEAADENNLISNQTVS